MTKTRKSGENMLTDVANTKSRENAEISRNSAISGMVQR